MIAAIAAGFIHAQPALAEPAAAESGKTIFLKVAEPPCGTCHTLADAGTKGQIGPVLDDLKPDADRVIAAVTNGLGIMPAYENLTADQIKTLAAYIASVTKAQ